MNVQASSAFTKSEVKAIKKGTFVHAKGKIGTKKVTLVKKEIRKSGMYTGLNYAHKYNKNEEIIYSLSLMKKPSYTVQTYNTVQFITANYNQKRDFSIFNKYLKRAKLYDIPYFGIVAYKTGNKYILIHKGKDSTTVQIFKNEKALLGFLASAN